MSNVTNIPNSEQCKSNSNVKCTCNAEVNDVKVYTSNDKVDDCSGIPYGQAMTRRSPYGTLIEDDDIMGFPYYDPETDNAGIAKKKD